MQRHILASLLLGALLLSASALKPTRVRRQAEVTDVSGASGEESGNISGSGSGFSGDGSASGFSGDGSASGFSGDGSASGFSGDSSSGIESSTESSTLPAFDDNASASGEETSTAEESGSGTDRDNTEIITDLPVGTIASLQTIQLNTIALQAQATALQLQASVIAEEAKSMSDAAKHMAESAGTTSAQLNTVILGIANNDAEELGSGSPTTAAPTIPTVAPIVPPTTTSNSTCSTEVSCVTDSDCGSGKCLGAFLNTCNCNACLNFLPCQTDAECGGLVGACNTLSKTCDCGAGFVKAGFPDMFNALTNFCNVKTCGANATESCSGLPCNKGNCIC